MSKTRSDEQNFNARINLLVLESLLAVKKIKTAGSFEVSAQTRATQYNNNLFNNKRLKALFNRAIKGNGARYFEGNERFQIQEVENVINNEHGKNISNALDDTIINSSNVIDLSESVRFGNVIKNYISERVTRKGGNYAIKHVDDINLQDFIYYVIYEKLPQEIILHDAIRCHELIDLESFKDCSEDIIFKYIESLERQLIIAKMANLNKEKYKGGGN